MPRPTLGTLVAALLGVVVTAVVGVLGAPLQALIVGALAVTAVTLRAQHPGVLAARLRRRFLLGVPWGTVLVVAGVLGVYLFVQGGLDDWYRPLTLPFSAWSYLYPLGWLTASFAHSGPGHLVGNLFGALAFAPIAEYAWGHFPEERGAASFGTWKTNPFVRAFVLFPLAAIAVGVGGTLVTPGALIGFSGVVFAFAGFALVNRPVAAIVALLGQRAARTVWRALQQPVVNASAGPSFQQPWWQGISVQGHIVGLFIGVGLATTLLWRRERRPDPWRLWLGVAIFVFAQNVWALWWYDGPGQFVLFRAAGVVLALALALVVALSIPVGDRHLFDEFTTRHVAIFALLLPVVLLGGIAVPTNAVTVADADLGDDSVEVRDYRVGYVENAPDARVAVFREIAADAGLPVPERPGVNASGVVVVSDRRQLWTEQVSKRRLAFAGQRRVSVGSLGWRDSVTAVRRGWSPAGNSTVYRVRLQAGNTTRTAYTAPPATADPTLAGRNVSVAAENSTFRLRVHRDGRTLGTAAIPTGNETVTAGNITFLRVDDRVRGRIDGTNVTVARKETYN
jgi:membrane associated rhomboid family serine protease